MKVATTSFAEEISATHEELSDVRRRVAAWLRDQDVSSDMLVGDVEMVLVELGANVVDHTNSSSMHIGIDLPDDRVVIEVSNPSSARIVPAVEEWGELIEGTRGRGLRIVRALCAAIVVSGDDTQTHIRCDIALPDETFA